nr:hypothetical protein [Tanacetum cinerariifolium]
MTHATRLTATTSNRDDRGVNERLMSVEESLANITRTMQEMMVMNHGLNGNGSDMQVLKKDKDTFLSFDHRNSSCSLVFVDDLEPLMVKDSDNAPNDSKEMVENNVGLRDLDIELKVSELDDGNKCVDVFDELCKEIAEDSSGIEKDCDYMMDHDVSWKDDVECVEIELKVSELDDGNKCVDVFDELCKEIAEDSSGIEKDCDYMMDHDVSWKDDVVCGEIELSVSEMDDKSKCVRSLVDELEIMNEQLYKEEVQRVHNEVIKDKASRSFADCSFIVEQGSGRQKVVGNDFKALKESNNNNDLNIKLLVNEKATTREFLSGHSKRLQEKTLEDETLKVANQKEKKEISVKGNKMFPNEGCRQKGVYMFGICHVMWYVQGWEDEDKDLNVFANDSDVHDLYNKVLSRENEFLANKNLSDLEMIKPGMEVQTELSDVDATNNEGCFGQLKFDI